MFVSIYSILTVALAAATVSTGRTVSFTNNCRMNIRPIIKYTTGSTNFTGPWLSAGYSLSMAAPANASSSLIISGRYI
ncbi:hypothetical protein RhiTH_011745 [Rhizoctonia solani]